MSCIPKNTARLQNGNPGIVEPTSEWLVKWIPRYIAMLMILTGCWYRLCHPRTRVSPPDVTETVQIVKQIHNKTINLEWWDQVPFPSPLVSYFDYVYTIDQDAGTFFLSKWSEVDGALTPLTLQCSLAEICETSCISDEALRQCFRPIGSDLEKDSDQPLETGSLEPLEIQTPLPTAIMELQQQFFLDFVFLWRSWIDDPMTWNYGSHVFNAFIKAILCLASWDFELS